MDRFEPKADAWDRSKVEAVVRAANTLLVAELSMKSVPAFRFDRPRPVTPKVTPWMFSVDLPVSLNTSFSLSPPSRLTPLYEASWAVVVIWSMMMLYDETKPARVVWATVSAMGADGVVKVSAVV